MANDNVNGHANGARGSAGNDSTLDKPRILCLHGGGVSAEIFRIQMRAFIISLAPHFRLVFPDGPYAAEMHDDLKVVYADFTNCRRWAGWRPEHPTVDNDEALAEIEKSLTTAMEADEGTGEWVGLLGFSQGAKTAFSMLFDTQLRMEDQDKKGVNGMYGGFNPENIPVGFAGGKWRFAILMAGRAPPYSLSEFSRGNKYFIGPGEHVADHQFPKGPCPTQLWLPTLHVHGLWDPGLDYHRTLLHDYCSKDSAKLIEWQEGHRLPFRSVDVDVVTKGILEAAKAGGC